MFNNEITTTLLHLNQKSNLLCTALIMVSSFILEVLKRTKHVVMVMIYHTGIHKTSVFLSPPL